MAFFLDRIKSNNKSGDDEVGCGNFSGRKTTKTFKAVRVLGHEKFGGRSGKAFPREQHVISSLNASQEGTSLFLLAHLKRKYIDGGQGRLTHRTSQEGKLFKEEIKCNRDGAIQRQRKFGVASHRSRKQQHPQHASQGKENSANQNVQVALEMLAELKGPSHGQILHKNSGMTNTVAPSARKGKRFVAEPIKRAIGGSKNRAKSAVGTEGASKVHERNTNIFVWSEKQRNITLNAIV